MVKAGLRLRVLPQTRGDCPEERPCPYVTCRHHLLIDIGEGEVAPGRGRLFFARDLDEQDEESIVTALQEMSETCALDVAERGGATFDEIGEILGVTYQRVEAVQVRAAARIRDRGYEFEEREHPEDPYIKYMNAGADELSELAAILKARQKARRK